MNYFDVFSLDGTRVDFATVLNEGTSTVFFGEELIHSFEVLYELSSCFALTPSLFAFYDYSGDRIGVISLADQKTLWTMHTKVCRTRYIGVDKIRGTVEVQTDDLVRLFDGISGEQVSEEVQQDELYFRSGKWTIQKRADAVFLLCSGDITKEFKSETSVDLIRGFGDLLIITENSSSFTIYDDSLRIVRKIRTSPNGRFSDCHLSRNGQLRIGFNDFTNVFQTEVWTYCDIEDLQPSKTIIPCAGKYVFTEDGEEVSFATGKVFMLRD